MLNIKWMLNGGYVKRYHTQYTVKEQTVGQHSYGVACLVYTLTDGCASGALIMAAITHDMAEQELGDVPSPAKKVLKSEGVDLDNREDDILDANYVRFSLTPEERRTLKLADVLEGVSYCLRELQMGNTHITTAFNNFCKYAVDMNMTAFERAVYDSILTS